MVLAGGISHDYSFKSKEVRIIEIAADGQLIMKKKELPFEDYFFDN